MNTYAEMEIEEQAKNKNNLNQGANSNDFYKICTVFYELLQVSWGFKVSKLTAYLKMHISN